MQPRGLDAAPGYRRLRELGGVSLGLMELVAYRLGWRKAGDSQALTEGARRLQAEEEVRRIQGGTEEARLLQIVRRSSSAPAGMEEVRRPCRV